MKTKKRVESEAADVARRGDTLRLELAGYLRDKSQVLQDHWVRQMRACDLLRAPPLPELETDFAAFHHTFADCLQTGEYEAVRGLARSMAQPVGRGRITTDRIIDSLLALRDVYWRSLFQKYQADTELLATALDLCFSVADRFLALVVLGIVGEQATVSQQEIDRLRMLVKTGMVLNAKLSLPAVLQRIANMACKLVGAQYGALGVVDGKGGLSQFITAGIDEKTKKVIGPLPVGKGILGVLVHEAKPLRLTDLTTDARAHGFPPNHPPMNSFLGVPIVSRGKVFGNLYLTEKQGAKEFSEADEAVAVTLAVQAAIAIENAGLYEELHRSYQELKQSQALLLRQEKLASLGRLAAGLAHELNNPLNTVAGFVEALQGRSQTESLQANKEFEDFPRFLRIVQTEVDRAAAIVRRLLDFARQREPSLELVDLGTLIAKSVAFVDRQAAVANQRIIVEPLRMPVRVRADAQMLQQLLLNVLTNALDAIEDGGDVRITVGITRAPHGSLGQKEMATLSIADNGCGIALENLTKIFDPFFTTKEVGKGTGLGLPICLSIVEQHEGTIEVKSEGAGNGTTVIVKLPIEKKVGDR